MLPVGSAVIDGPDSSSNYGIDGTVVSEFDYISDTIDVQAHERYFRTNYLTTKTFSWGKNGRYEIQLRHSTTPLKVYEAVEAF